MAEFYPAVTTNQGIALSAGLLVGEQLVFSRLVTGSGNYGEEELERTYLQNATEIREPRQEFEFSSIEKVTDSCVLLKTLISNVELTEGYRMTEIGVYVRKKGEEGGEILYSLSVAKEADFFPCYNGMAAVEILEEYYLTVSDSAEVSIQAGSAASVMREDFEIFREEITQKLEVAFRNLIDLQKQIGDISKLRTEEKDNLVGAINELAEIVRPLNEYCLATNQDIDKILAGIYVEDTDGVTLLDIASNLDMDDILAGVYADDADDEGDIASDEDIDAIIAGTYVEDEEEEDSGQEDDINGEIVEIIENSFKEESENGVVEDETP